MAGKVPGHSRWSGLRGQPPCAAGSAAIPAGSIQTGSNMLPSGSSNVRPYMNPWIYSSSTQTPSMFCFQQLTKRVRKFNAANACDGTLQAVHLT